MVEVRGSFESLGRFDCPEMSVMVNAKAWLGGATNVKGNLLVLGELTLAGNTTVLVGASLTSKPKSKVILMGHLLVLGLLSIDGDWVKQGSLVSVSLLLKSISFTSNKRTTMHADFASYKYSQRRGCNFCATKHVGKVRRSCWIFQWIRVRSYYGHYRAFQCIDHVVRSRDLWRG